MYADNLIVLVNTQKDIDILSDTVNNFGFIFSAKVNWGKREALMVGGKLGDRLRLPGGLVWKKGGLKGDIECPFYHKLIWFFGVLMKCL